MRAAYSPSSPTDPQGKGETLRPVLREGKTLRGLMIVGLCSSCAMVPALSLFKGGGEPTRGSVGTTRRIGSSPRAASPAFPSRPATPLAAALPAAAMAAASVAFHAAVAPALVAAPPAGALPQRRWSATGRRAVQGAATWLDTIPTGTCANNDAPMGSVITVSSASGISVTCKVVSTGPFATGRIVDLAKATFARLAPVSQGVVGVAVVW